MIQIFPFRGWGLMRVVQLVLVLLAGLSAQPQAAWATHIRAGDIQAKSDTTASPNPRRIFFRMVLYTDPSAPGKQPAATIFFGDGTSSCNNGVPRVIERAVPGSPDTNINIYLFEHTYPSSGTFTVHFIGENRVEGVLNMENSVNQSFYISTSITISPSLGRNRSPVLTAPAIDKGARGQVFLHNPAAFDADGDSLAFRLRTSQKVNSLASDIVGPPCPGATGDNTPIPRDVPNFRYPNDPAITGSVPLQVPYSGIPAGVPGSAAIFVQDPYTGQITWNAPERVGVYNVAMVVEEWRRTPGGRQKIGEVIRDMQIIVSGTTNLRPTITVPPDLCVVAGERVRATVTAVDGSSPSSPATAVSLFAYSGILPPATFQQTAAGPPQAQGTFEWQTTCQSVARLPYLVVFKAQDTPSPATANNPPLIDEKPWRITVVGPPPQNLQAQPVVTGLNAARLTWDPYTCANAQTIYIYRKEGPSSFVPGPCQTGIPAEAGYERVGQVSAGQSVFVDENVSAGGVRQGLERGKTYCYRIYAEFPLPAGGASIASREVCLTFPGRSAQLIKVDVEATSVSSGQIQVCWTQPRGGALPLPGTPSYVLSRAEGLSPAPAAFVPVATLSSLLDTCYTDTNLNTEQRQYTYRLEFVRTFADGTPPVREVAAPASSVRVSVVPTAAATGMQVSWTYQVPWDNTAEPVQVYRRAGLSGAFVLVGPAPTGAGGGSYLDTGPGLVKGETYCYYVRTRGQYASIPYLRALDNRSQQQCALLISPPCRPVLRLAPLNCDSLAALPVFPTGGGAYRQRVSWRLSAEPAGCDAGVVGYRLYYRPTLTGRFALLTTTGQTSFVHEGLSFSQGCYAVQAVGASGVVSDTSNVACQDNCVFFVLPNIFTPNGDMQNEVFRPKNYSPVRRVRFQAFNRWGVRVFENTTSGSDGVLINWGGGSQAGETGRGSRVPDGVYYYLAEVEFADAAATRRSYKGWVEIVR
ncbi:gliding motility-associated C-terminal domain-containing protein [Hymenobacter sp. BT664]|uniref:Gliding motility-associated C-terminal domain-containing protein n=1 Tax=Hymenobacter montanus TaxID=2771359 RepID=A0A927BF34_9BACT|nr:gliding motility-associated C-terminal domain-containing protein [Hymenobacter montanus]MBD2768899.1 gliding motility-associated C-terminal domain-containing protein [Hymenobacter montanus]